VPKNKYFRLKPINARRKIMGEKLHVTEGKSTGGIVGSIVSGIIMALFSNFTMGGQMKSVSLRVVFALLSILSIPIAILSQKIFQIVYDLIHGKDSLSVYFAKNWLDLIQHKFLGALAGSLIYCFLIFLILF
jgi:hypothetical protein